MPAHDLVMAAAGASSAPGGITFVTPFTIGAPGSTSWLKSIVKVSTNLYVAVGVINNEFSVDTNTFPFYATSFNGTTSWGSVDVIGGYSYNCNLVAVTKNASGLIVAVGNNTSNYPVYCTSTDGYTWTNPVQIAAQSCSVQAIAVNSSGTFVMIARSAASGAPVYFTSTNGTSWSGPNNFNGSTAQGNLAAITVSSTGRFVATGSTATTNYPWFSTSTNGTTWTTPATMNGSTTYAIMNGVTVDSTGKFVAIGNTTGGTSVAAISTDGTTWTTPTSIGSSAGSYYGAITVNSNNRFLAFNTLFSTSADGVTWTAPAVMGTATNSRMISGTSKTDGSYTLVGRDPSNNAAVTYSTV